MSKELRFDDRVAIVTGAGGGLGKTYALLLAARGAKVVVNDLGGGMKGGGSSSKAADEVVAEIKAAGGEATANYDSVEFGDKIVQTAVDAYGKVDIVINNAGILRDVSFHKMTEEDWNLIFKVHVFGSFSVTHAAWPIMREQGYGRVVMTASAAGIYGNFGQANYSAAKLALLGFSNTLAIEGRRKGIVVNTIAPLAASRLTETVLPPNMMEVLSPELVAPFVARLVHESNEDTGGVYEVGGGFMGKLRWERAAGKVFRMGRAVTPEDVDKAWGQITGMDQTTHPRDITASMEPVIDNINAGPSKGGNDLIDVDQALGYKFPETTSSYDERDVAVYALGVGAAANPTDDLGLQQVYEMHGSGMKVLPTFGVIPAINTLMSSAKKGIQAPGLNYGLDRLLHGEQVTELKRPLPPKATLSHRARIKDIFDKGKHALVVTEVVSYDEDGNELVRNELTSLIRGAGGWGGDRGPSADVNVPPDRAPDATVEEKIPDNQALLYRLSGDWNPLHVDPGFAKAFGFDKPILHGLCTFGYAGRHVISKFAKDADPRYFKSIQTRFADSVFPGETLITEMWKESDTKIVFRTRVKERDSVVISNAAVELFTEIPKPAPKAKPKAAGAAAPAAPISADIFNAIGQYVADNAGLVDKVKTVFGFQLSNPSSQWTIDLANGAGSVKPVGGDAQCTLALSDGDFMDMATGKADAMKLFSSGKLKISGDMMAAQKLGFLKKITPEMVMDQMKKRGGAGSGDAAPAASADMEPTSWDVFIAIRDHVKRNPDLVGKVKTKFLFKVTNPDSLWTLDLSGGEGAVVEGDTGSPECTLEISEADFISMTKGEANPMKLFTTGKLKISGNVMASQKLDFLQKIDPEQAKEAVIAARAAGEGPGGGGSSAPSSSSASASASANAPAIFAALDKRLADKPELKDEVRANIEIAVTDPAAIWKADLAGGGDTTVLTIADADLTALVKGDATAKQLFQRGKLRIDGDITVGHRLGFLKGLI